jgi:hypothetical protein
MLASPIQDFPQFNIQIHSIPEKPYTGISMHGSHVYSACSFGQNVKSTCLKFSWYF